MERQAATKVQNTPARSNHLQTQSARSAARSSSAAHPLLELQQAIGNQAVQRLINSPYIQTKLQVSTPGDPFEQEADQVADQVMRMPDYQAHRGVTVSNRTQISRLDRMCTECEEEKNAIQRKSVEEESLEEHSKKGYEDVFQRKPNHGRELQASHGVQSQIDSLRSGGQPIPESARAFFEPRFGHDFRDVRVHTGAQAAQIARSVNARAFTVGNNVAFGAGQYSPETSAGRNLLAHELTHTIQQTGSGSSVGARLQRKIGDNHDLRSPRFTGDVVLEACFDNERLLKLGSQGPAVAKIQQALIDAGFPLPQFGVDGIFKSETQTALRNYQRAHEIGVDGIVGPITMGELDNQFAAPRPPAPVPPGPAPGPKPSPPSTQCSDQPVNFDKDPLPDFPLFTVRTMSAPELLVEAKNMQPEGVPAPSKPPLGASQPTFTERPVTVTALPLPDTTCMKCVAEWDVPPQFTTLIAVGTFTDEPKRFAAIQRGDASGCPSKPIPDLLEVIKIILPEAIPFVVAGELEHFLDFVRAFRIVGGRYLANVRRLTAARTHLRAKDQQQCEDKVQEFLLRAHGKFLLLSFPFLSNYSRMFQRHFTELYNMPDRDRTKKHDAFPSPPNSKPPTFPSVDLGKNPFGCGAFCRKFNSRSFPGIPGGSSESLIKDNNMPQKNVWHVM